MGVCNSCNQSDQASDEFAELLNQKATRFRADTCKVNLYEMTDDGGVFQPVHRMSLLMEEQIYLDV